MKIHSPGRINLIGEHVDYTGGLVMPASIDKGISFEARRVNERHLVLHATDLNETYTLPLPVTGKTDKLWVNYLAGIVDQFQRLDYEVPGLAITFGGDVPRGSGMSSSAALEGGMAFLLNELTGAGLTRPELAQLCQRSSNNFLGIPSGIMDQFASLNGSEKGPILLNCDTLKFDRVDANLNDHVWLLFNSMVTHELSGGEYHTRVSECQQALDALQRQYPNLSALSNATEPQLTTVMSRLPDNVAKRARYVIGENERVRSFATALSDGNAQRAGELLNQTHIGLRDEYEVSCEEVDTLQRLAVQHPSGGVRGARIMGGGFGGCTLNLVSASQAEEVRGAVLRGYLEAHGIQAECYTVVIGPGTHVI